MEKKKEVRFSISKRNWERAKKKAGAAGVSLSSWIACSVEDRLNEEDAMKALSPETEKAFAEKFPEIYADLLVKAKRLNSSALKPAMEGLKKTTEACLHSDALDKTSQNRKKQMKSFESAVGRIKEASRNSVNSESWDKTSKRLHAELKALEPSLEKIKKASREHLKSERIEKASKQFSEQMRSIEAAVKKLKEKGRG